MSEDELQKAVARLLDHSGLLWCHVPNGGQRNAITGAKLKKMGTKRGVPDVIIFSRGAVQGHSQGFGGSCALELKVGYNKPSKEQHEWLARLRDEGWRCEVCYSMDDVLKVLRDHYPNTFPS